MSRNFHVAPEFLSHVEFNRSELEGDSSVFEAPMRDGSGQVETARGRVEYPAEPNSTPSRLRALHLACNARINWPLRNANLSERVTDGTELH